MKLAYLVGLVLAAGSVYVYQSSEVDYLILRHEIREAAKVAAGWFKDKEPTRYEVVQLEEPPEPPFDQAQFENALRQAIAAEITKPREKTP